MFQQSLTGLRLRRYLAEPYGGFDRLNLAEEWADVAELVMSPVLQQASGFGRYLPVRRRQAAPLVYVLAQLIDDRRRVILLLFRREPFAFVEDHLLLFRSPLPLAGLRDRRDELRAPAALDDLLGRLPLGIKLPVSRRALIRRVKDGAFEKRVRHVQLPAPGLRRLVEAEVGAMGGKSRGAWAMQPPSWWCGP